MFLIFKTLNTAFFYKLKNLLYKVFSLKKITLKKNYYFNCITYVYAINITGSNTDPLPSR